GLTIANSTVSGNRATAIGGQGPPIATQVGGLVQGGGIFALTAENGFAATGIAVSGKDADASGGAGGNRGLGQGGGVFPRGTAPDSLTGSTVSFDLGRAAGVADGVVQGAGLFAVNTEPGPFAVLSTTLAINRAEPVDIPEGAGNIYNGGRLTIR